jgi:hypothetical protein
MNSTHEINKNEGGIADPNARTKKKKKKKNDK